MLVTVFTPLYNREKSIRAVYDSLCAQTNKNFEWLVLNDGSTDKSDEIMDSIIARHQDVFPIRYYKKQNEGLMRTINRALDLAKGTMFCRLDSDDYALPNAMELIQEQYPLIAEKNDICAIAFLSQHANGTQVGHHPFDENTICSSVDYRFIFHGTGDRSEVMKLDVYRHYKFPEFEGEKFCSEGVVWNRIALKYKMLYVNKPIYVKGFESDTITADIYNTLKRSCMGTSLMYYEFIRNFPYLPYKARLINTIKYYRYAFFAKMPVVKGIPVKLLLIGLPVGLVVVLLDTLKSMLRKITI